MTVQPGSPRSSAFQEPLRNLRFLETGAPQAAERSPLVDEVRLSPAALAIQQGPDASQGQQALEQQLAQARAELARLSSEEPQSVRLWVLQRKVARLEATLPALTSQGAPPVSGSRDFWNSLPSGTSGLAWGGGTLNGSLLGTEGSATAGSLRPSQTGQEMATAAARHARGRGGRCFRYVADVLDRFGVVLKGRSAWMAAGQLARHAKMAEVKGLSTGELPKLPAGAVVVWNRGNGHLHGHISVSLGDGREASDVIRPQSTDYGTSFRVFVPRDMAN